MSDPRHNLDALLLGTSEFSFCEGATSAADARAKGYLDFGNIVAISPKAENKVDEHYGSYRGVRKRDKTSVIESKLGYTVKVDEWNHKNVAIVFAGSTGTEFTQSSETAQNADALAFTAQAPSGTQKWYDLTISGARKRNLTTVTISGKTEGTDFEVDKTLGRVRFLVSQTASVTCVVTCPAIATGADGALAGYTPLGKPLRTGYGRVVIFDQNDKGKVVLDHVDFACQVTAESIAEVDGQKSTEITLRVDVDASAPGTMYVRNPNIN